MERSTELAARSESKERVKGMVEWHNMTRQLQLNRRIRLQSVAVKLLRRTLNLKTGKLQNHKREDLITKICPAIFDLSTTCPRWENLSEIFEVF